MTKSTSTMAQQIAEVASAFQQQRTGHEPKSVSVVLSGDTLVVTLHGALSPAEQALAQSSEGAEKVREFHRHLFLTAFDTLRQEIQRITGMDVREATADVEPKSGAVVQVFTSGTMVQVFLLSGKLPAGSFNSRITPDISGPRPIETVDTHPVLFDGSGNFASEPISSLRNIDMLNKNSVIALFDQHTQAEKAIQELQQAGFDMKALSIVGKGYHTEEDVVGYYTAGDRMKYWGKNGAFWGGIWGLLFGSAFFMIPGIGPLIAAGPLVGWIAAALEGAAVVGGLSAVGAGLYSIGIPKKSILQYETSLKAGCFMLVVHGTSDEVARAKAILASTGASETQIHMAKSPVAALV